MKQKSCRPSTGKLKHFTRILRNVQHISRGVKILFAHSYLYPLENYTSTSKRLARKFNTQANKCVFTDV